MTKQTRAERWDRTAEEVAKCSLSWEGDVMLLGNTKAKDITRMCIAFLELRQHADDMREALEAAVIDIDAKPKGEFDDYLIDGLKQNIKAYDKFLQEEVE